MISLSLFDLLALGLVIFIGLPHGAFDGAVYALLPNQASDGARKKSLPLFLGLYVTLTIAIILIWLALPLASLSGFLALSAYHFGKGDTEGFHGYARILALIVHGGLVTIWLPVIHHEQALAYFAALTFRDLEMMRSLSSVFFGIGALWAGLLIIYGRMAWVNPYYRGRFAEVIILAIAMGFLPLIPAFALYFCFIHSRRHFTALYQATKSLAPQSVWPLGLGLSLASWLAGGIMLFILNQTQDFAISAIQIIFIGLAALTVPHMILIDGLWRPLARFHPFAQNNSQNRRTS